VTTARPMGLAPDGDIALRSRAERSRLRRELGRLDAVCLLVAAIVVLDTLGAVAEGGAQTLTWLLVVAALFLVPAGLVVAELGAAFPDQGGPYVWARLAFGRDAGSLVALAYFLETPVWVGGSLAITCVAVVDRLVLPLEGGWRVAVALAFVWTTVALAVAPLRAGKRVPLAGAATQVGLLAFFTATVAAYAVGHGVHAPAVGDLAPSWAVFAPGRPGAGLQRAGRARVRLGPGRQRPRLGAGVVADPGGGQPRRRGPAGPRPGLGPDGHAGGGRPGRRPGRHRHHPGRLRRGRRRQPPLLQRRPDPRHLAARPGQPGGVPEPGPATLLVVRS
jgi:hypothetical protein